MILEALRIDRGYISAYDRANGTISPLTGEVTFAGSNGKVQLALNEETSKKILAVVAEQLVESSKELAEKMTAEIIQAAPALLPNSPN